MFLVNTINQINKTLFNDTLNSFKHCAGNRVVNSEWQGVIRDNNYFPLTIHHALFIQKYYSKCQPA
jgi:hypothetical protein